MTWWLALSIFRHWLNMKSAKKYKNGKKTRKEEFNHQFLCEAFQILGCLMYRKTSIHLNIVIETDAMKMRKIDR